MTNKTEKNISKIVVPVDKTAVTQRPAVQTKTASPAKQIKIGHDFAPFFTKWAPAWFYSALGWLGKSYYDGSNTERSFAAYLAGSNVDPYQKLGSTRLFRDSISEGRIFSHHCPGCRFRSIRLRRQESIQKPMPASCRCMKTSPPATSSRR